MWRLAVVVAVFVAGMQAAFAQEAVLNNPSKAVEVAKSVISKLDISYETLWLVSDGGFSQGASASIYGIESNDIHVASVRAGFGTNETLYGGVGLDLPGLVKRFVPQGVKGIATVKPLDLLWSAVGKYARVTPVGGYSWGDDKAVYGVAVGAAFSF